MAVTTHTVFYSCSKWTEILLDRKPEGALVHEALEQILSASKQHQFKAIRSHVTVWGPKEAGSIQVSDLYIKFPEAFSKYFMQVTLQVLWSSPVSILPHMHCIQIMHVSCLHRQWSFRNLNDILLCQWQSISWLFHVSVQDKGTWQFKGVWSWW